MSFWPANAAPQYSTAALTYNRAAWGGAFPALLATRGRRHSDAMHVHPRLKNSAIFSAAWECRPDGVGAHTTTCVPTSTTRPVGMWKKSVASLADLAKPMNNRSCQRGMREWAAGLSARRDRKNDVDMMSKCQPCLRATASAFGTFGDSI